MSILFYGFLSMFYLPPN